MTLTNNQKKLLTRFLGECWHEGDRRTCKHCGEIMAICDHISGDGVDWEHRTFDAWQDLGDLKEKLEEKGLWTKFYNYCASIHQDENTSDKRSVVRFTVWLLNPATFMTLVAEFLKDKNG